MSRTKSSNLWLQEHRQDEYVKKAKEKGYRCRAVFKLEEIQKKDRLLKPQMNVIDLGAAPGGWSEYTRKVLGKSGKVIGLDILPIEEITGVDFILGDFREDGVLENLYKVLDNAPVDVVLSDMAPNLSGNKAIDLPASLYLAELALDTAQTVLVKGGSFLVKLFQGPGSDAYIKEVRKHFTSVVIRKPKASRARSSEVYILAKGFK